LHSNELITEQIPSWFIYLLYDGLITTLPTYCEEDNKNGIIGRENWSIQQLHQFLEIEQAGLGEKLLFVIFDRQNIAELLSVKIGQHNNYINFLKLNKQD